jgi:uncharacterized SAM-binding protein YcdF (DUF218 family)
VKALLTLLVVPPGNLPLLALAGLALWRRPGGRALAWAAVVLTVLLSLPAVSYALIGTLQWGVPRQVGPGSGAAPGAIIVLSADLGGDAPGGVISGPGVGLLTLGRLEAGAVLARRTGLPLLLSGGEVGGRPPSLGQRMADVLARDYGIRARWIEGRSADTWQNAADSAGLLRRDGVGRAYVVTDAWHMRRALLAFRAAGFPVVPAPSRFAREPRWEVMEFLPHATAWLRSYLALHEWIGLAWYGLWMK